MEDRVLAQLKESFSSPSLKPMLLQAMMFASGRWYLTVAVDMLMRLKEVKREVTGDSFCILFRTTDVYKMVCKIGSHTDMLFLHTSVRIVRLYRGETTKYDIMFDEIIERYFKISGDGRNFLTWMIYMRH
jgi:hypothetical protein